MDRYGRKPVLVVGFLVGGTGCALTALGTHTTSTVAVIVGFTLTGSSSAAALLVRTAAGDMYSTSAPRARHLVCPVSGRVTARSSGQRCSARSSSGKELTADDLTVPWLAAAGISVFTATIVSLVRPDTKKIAELIAPADEPVAPW